MSKSRVRCPGCRKEYTVDESLLGKNGRCKNCGQKFRLSDAESDPPQPTCPATAASQEDRATSPKDWVAGQAILEDFVVERELGAGGMGKVYLLRSRSTSQRFAVKRAILPNEANRRDFLAELKTWIDLPEHPHLAACRFFRTVGDEIVIFAEFVEARLAGDAHPEAAVDEPGAGLGRGHSVRLGSAHGSRIGLVHQDVKPGNALMTADGLVKVADFGLAGPAKAEESSSPGRPKPPGQLRRHDPSLLLPRASGKDNRCPDRRTSGVGAWQSWRCSSARRPGATGQAAPEVLKAYLKRPVAPDMPAMPKGVVEVLQKCFRREPAERWASLHEAAEALQQTYRQEVGKDYPLAPAVLDAPRQAVVHDRRTNTGSEWDDPREWLVQAFEADGRDPAEVEAFLPPRGGSQAQAIADLAAYEEALRIFDRLRAAGRKDLEIPLAALCTQKAFIHNSTDDVPGALALYDRVISIREQLVKRGRQEWANELAHVYMLKAVDVGNLGDFRAAVALYDQALSIRERLVEQDDQWELASDLARTYMNKAISVGRLGDRRGAVALYDRTIATYERLVEHEDVRNWKVFSPKLTRTRPTR